MIHLVLLDSGPLGLLSNPKASTDAERCRAWLDLILERGSPQVRVPAIIEYEIRRDLTRAGRRSGLEGLDRLIDHLGYEPLNRKTLRLAAQLWAEARLGGYPTSGDEHLDVDVILWRLRRGLPADMASRWSLPRLTSTT